MSSGYQMTDAIAMPGGILEVGHDGDQVVMHIHGRRQARLAREGRKQFQRAFMAAERAAETYDPAHPF